MALQQSLQPTVARPSSGFRKVMSPLSLFRKPATPRAPRENTGQVKQVQKKPTGNAPLSTALSDEASRAKHSRLSFVREALAITAVEDSRIASAIGGQLAPLDFQLVFLKALEFKRRLLALRVIQRRSREVLRNRAEQGPYGGSSVSLCTGSSDHLPAREAEIVAGIKLLDQRLSFASLQQEQMADDGNCQFRALSYQLFGTQERHDHVRRVAVEHMRARQDDYGIYFFTHGEFDTFLTNMQKPRTWGDEFTLRAAADAFGCNVHVLTSDNSNWHLCYEGQAAPTSADVPVATAPKRKLFLTYIAPVHYNSVRRHDLASLEAALP